MTAARAPQLPPAFAAPAAGLAAAYLLVFLGLDWVSYIRPYQGLNITPWNPQPALAIALLLHRPRWFGLVWASLALAELLVRGWPENGFVTLAATAALALSFATIARLLRLRLDPALALATRRDLAWLTAAAFGGAALSAALYVGTLAAGGHGPESGVAGAMVRYWVGDAVGVVVMLPLLLVLLDPQRRAEFAAAVRSREAWLVAALTVALLTVVFLRVDHDPFKFFYLLFLPVGWAAARLGLAGAVLASALTQVGLIVAVQAGPNADLTVFELQVLMAALTMAGLLVGVTVDERARAEAGLRGSLRLAAAGQMTAALAHELSQPLTALNGYAQAARLLAASPDLPAPDRLARLSDIAGRMADDALRASEVVKRLRDFFRTGSTQLQTVPIAPLIADALAAAQRRADAQGTRLEASAAPAGTIVVDPVQFAVVLRNLLANALDAAAGPGSWVRLEVRTDGGTLDLAVHDSGPGIDAARLARLFEPGASDKPGAMGIGLSISRAIVEAHGGRLGAEPGPGGRFRLALPLGTADAGEAHDAP